MFPRFVFLIFFIFIIFFVYLSFYNSNHVLLTLSSEKKYQLPLIQLLFIAFFLGGIMVFVSYLVYDLQKVLERWRVGRREKKRLVVQELYQQGMKALLHGEKDKGRDLLLRYLEKEPANVEAYIRLAEVYRQEENYVEAIKILNRGKLVDPNNMGLLFRLVRSYKGAQKMDEAINALENIIDITPYNLEALKELRDIYRGIKRWEDACDVQKKVIKYVKEKDKHRKELNLLLCFKYEYGNQLLQEGRYDEAEKVFKEMIKQDRKFITSFIGLGDAYYKSGRIDDARDIWEKSFASSSEIIFLHRLEAMFLKEEQPDRILEGYRNILAERPDDVTVRLFYGKLCLRLEMVEVALDQLLRLKTSGIDFPELHYLLAEAYRRRERFEESVEEFQKAVAVRRKMVIPFSCSGCCKEFTKWSACCPNCGQFNTFTMPFSNILDEMTADNEVMIDAGRV